MTMETRLDERHVAVRFGDHGCFKAGVDDGGEWVVTLDGKVVTNFVAEAYAGRDGWVMLYSKPWSLTRVTGAVTVCYGPRPLPAELV